MSFRRSLSTPTPPEEQQSFLHSEPLLGGANGGGGGVVGPGELLPTSTRPTTITSNEILHSLANRILHSSFYKWFYLIMAFVSVTCLVLSFMSRCPSGYFYILETIVNLAMILEVGIRMLALRKIFWRNLWNVLDLLLVLLCVLTLLWLALGECTTERSWEAEADTILLVLRNMIQFFRLMMMLAKNGQNMSRRTQNIDFSTVDTLSVGAGIGDLGFGGPGGGFGGSFGGADFLDFEGEDDGEGACVEDEEQMGAKALWHAKEIFFTNSRLAQRLGE
ncbi:hypothetical protein HK101_005367 [Irineochytrium annulatum]|nr:hypothetical protein HK101_005367 [Irineochytrium annulatum]